MNKCETCKYSDRSVLGRCSVCKWREEPPGIDNYVAIDKAGNYSGDFTGCLGCVECLYSHGNVPERCARCKEDNFNHFMPKRGENDER